MENSTPLDTLRGENKAHPPSAPLRPAARPRPAPQAFEDLGMEAIRRIDVKNFPAFIIIDDKGNDFFQALNLG